jgi:hypothetical protein
MYNSRSFTSQVTGKYEPSYVASTENVLENAGLDRGGVHRTLRTLSERCRYDAGYGVAYATGFVRRTMSVQWLPGMLADL